jgi:hypothetical protein
MVVVLFVCCICEHLSILSCLLHDACARTSVCTCVRAALFCYSKDSQFSVETLSLSDGSMFRNLFGGDPWSLKALNDADQQVAFLSNRCGRIVSSCLIENAADDSVCRLYGMSTHSPSSQSSVSQSCSGASAAHGSL